MLIQRIYNNKRWITGKKDNITAQFTLVPIYLILDYVWVFDIEA